MDKILKSKKKLEKTAKKEKTSDDYRKAAKLKALSGIAFGVEKRPDVPEIQGSPNEQAGPVNDLNDIYEVVARKKGMKVPGKKDKDDDEDDEDGRR